MVSTSLRGLLVSVLLCPAVLTAATITVQPDPPVNVGGIEDAITGADMAGLIVTATYRGPSGLTSGSASWLPTGPTSGAAISAGDPSSPPAWSVSLTGDTNDSFAWHYSATLLGLLVSLEFDGTTAGLVFDRSAPGPGSPGSGPGTDIVFGALQPAGADAATVVTYARAVGIGNQQARGDLFARLLIDFSQVPSPFGPGFGGLPPQDFSFTQDSDRTVPEPATGVLAAGGLVLLSALRRRLR
jgi:hypothetical protein